MAGIKDTILAADDLVAEDVDVPEWGVKLQVRGLSGTDRDSFEAKMVAIRKGTQDPELRLQDFRSRLLVKCLHDPESGERIFEDREVTKLGRKSGQVIDRLFDTAKRLSGMGDDAEAAARGNSETVPSDGSTSD